MPSAFCFFSSRENSQQALRQVITLKINIAILRHKKLFFIIFHKIGQRKTSSAQKAFKKLSKTIFRLKLCQKQSIWWTRKIWRKNYRSTAATQKHETILACSKFTSVLISLAIFKAKIVFKYIELKTLWRLSFRAHNINNEHEKDYNIVNCVEATCFLIPAPPSRFYFLPLNKSLKMYVVPHIRDGRNCTQLNDPSLFLLHVNKSMTWSLFISSDFQDVFVIRQILETVKNKRTIEARTYKKFVY